MSVDASVLRGGGDSRGAPRDGVAGASAQASPMPLVMPLVAAPASPPALSPVLERPTRALLDLIETERARQCDVILGGAKAQAAALLAKARADAHAQLRLAFTQQRQRRRERIAAAQAQLATQRRLHEQQRVAALLRQAWQQLPQALLALWHEPGSRAGWVAQVLAFARARLPQGAWRIVHAPDWPEPERNVLVTELGSDVQFHADPAVRAGLKVQIHGNVLDATLGGLLSERAEVEAHLLRRLEQGMQGEPKGTR
jgi:hypothetical protein